MTRRKQANPSMPKMKSSQAMRRAWAQFEDNMVLAEEIQGYALLLETKNVALVDVSEHTKGRK